MPQLVFHRIRSRAQHRRRSAHPCGSLSSGQTLSTMLVIVKDSQENRFRKLSAQEQVTARAIVSKVRQRFDGQLVSAILFGSRARGEAAPGSDMDLLIVLSTADEGIRRQVRDLAVEVWLQHGVYPSTRVWSLAHWRRLAQIHTRLYQSIQRDGLDLLQFSPPPG